MRAKGKMQQARDVAYRSEVAFLSFTEDLLKMMEDSDVSQAELARRVGVSRGYISRVFRGVEKPHARNHDQADPCRRRIGSPARRAA